MQKLMGVIDIGSYSVRLVIYDVSRGLIEPVFNQKAICCLAHGLDETGEILEDAYEAALIAMSEFRLVLDEHRVEHVYPLATAAVRDARNGAEFAREAGLRLRTPLRILPGEEEARYSAMSVLSQVAHPLGLVGDLGGGSLELIHMDHDTILERASLPLGHLRLMDHLEAGEDIDEQIDLALDSLPWLELARGQKLYAIGGRWRDIGKIYLNDKKLPREALTSLHLPCDKFAKFLEKKIITIKKHQNEPYFVAAIVMLKLFERLGLEEVVFMTVGLREGFLLEQLAEDTQAHDLHVV